IVFTVLSLTLPFHSWSQGCSDAGFCTMGAMKPDQPFNKKIPIKLRSMEVSFYRGTTTLSPIVYVGTLDMSFNLLDDKTFFQIKLPYQAVQGNFGKTSGMSDISLCLTRNIFSSGQFDFNISIGGKIPSNDADLKDETFDLPLPMYYQTSLGTYDIIAGMSMISRQWLFATGIQHPFNRNKNHFTWAPWIPVYQNGEGADYVRSYDGAYELKRGTDVMLRIERNFRFSRINFSAGVLPIFRIVKDEVTQASTGERIKPDRTTGMAMSAIVTAGYSFNIQSGVKILYGRKISQREVNPDGLTRHDVATISYYYRF
ncbi:MAG: hypothetical protein WD824_09740, partial [Cyclobacteriaceae bacterium]